jgi:cytochrome c-type biogenesis protein CcmH
MAPRAQQLEAFMHRPSSAIVCILVNALFLLSLCTTAWALQWQDIAGELMSPACPGRTLVNCTSGHAEQWRELIRQKIDQGETKAQIMQYFVDMRGEEILAAPPAHGFALTAWLFPILVIINGAGLIVALTYRWTRKRIQPITSDIAVKSPLADSSAPIDPYHTRLQRELKDFSA